MPETAQGGTALAVTHPLNKDYALKVNTGTDLSPVWTEIGHRKSLSMTYDTSYWDAKDADSDGWSDEYTIGHALSFESAHNLAVDDTTGAKDAGQAACEAVMWEDGEDNKLSFQITEPYSLITWTFKASVSVTPFGGDNDSGAEWKLTMKCSGKPTLGGGAGS